MADLTVDLRKVMAESERMAKGEIAYDPGYLEELVEFSDPSAVMVPGSLVLALECPECGGPLRPVVCPECAIADLPDCPLCEGYGTFWECPTCDA